MESLIAVRQTVSLHPYMLDFSLKKQLLISLGHKVLVV